MLLLIVCYICRRLHRKLLCPVKNWSFMMLLLYMHTFFFHGANIKFTYSKTYLKQPLKKRPKFGFHNQLSLNAGQKYCRMLQGEHSAILMTFIKLPCVIKIYVLSIFEWPLKTDFTVYSSVACCTIYHVPHRCKNYITLLHTEKPKSHRVLVFLYANGERVQDKFTT